MTQSSMMLSLLFIFLIGNVMQFCTSQHGPKIQIETTYQYHEDVIPNTVNIRCTPSLTGSCAKRIILLQLTKDHKTIASLGENNDVTYGHLQKSSVKAEGRVDSKVSDSFLSVTLFDVMKQDSGIYTCTVTYLNQFSHMEHETASGNVTIGDQDVQDVVRHLMAKLSFLESFVKFQQNRTQEKLSYLETTAVDQGAQLQTQEQQTNQLGMKLQTQEQLTKQLGTKLQTQEQQTKQLMEKSDLNYVFLAGYGTDGNLKIGDILQFPDVKLNTGDAFDKDTGVFTAPIHGLYYFHLFMATDNYGYSSRLQVYISANDQEVATLHTHNAGNNDQTSAGVSIVLKAGQTVLCVVRGLSRNNSKPHAFPYTGFTGHLVKAL